MIKNINYSELRKIIWPIEKHECTKFLLMASMMFCILFNYSALRTIKDSLVVSGIGAEAIGFLKTYMVFPSAILFMLLYAKLCNIFNQKKIFYLLNSIFTGYFVLFAFILYPNIKYLHPEPETINNLVQLYPFAQWFIKIGGKWIYATFYIISELYGSVVLSLLFWQFANQIVKTQEAKRFYPMFGLLANLALPFAGTIMLLLDSDIIPFIASISKDMRAIPIVLIIILSSLTVKFIYSKINSKILNNVDLENLNTDDSKPKKKKPKLSFGESMKIIFSSKYIALLAVLVLSYGVSINLVEGVWKSQVKELYPDQIAYRGFMSKFQIYQGFIAIFFMIIGSNILRKVTWKKAALFTPIMILCTGLFFFLFVMSRELSFIAAIVAIAANPVSIAVLIGAIQNILSKATKYSLFDSTKEMAYIPLDNELRTKGKAAVDVIGGRLGKSGGGFIQSTIFILFPAYGFNEAAPFLGFIFFAVVVAWIAAVFALNKEYEKLVK